MPDVVQNHAGQARLWLELPHTQTHAHKQSPHGHLSQAPAQSSSHPRSTEGGVLEDKKKK